MLSMSLAFRQQGRCLQAAFGRSSLLRSPISVKNSLGAVQTKTDLTKEVDNKSTLVPARHFSASLARPSSGKDHVRLWSAERLVSAAMIPGIIVPFMYTTPITDAVFCTLLVLHSHWGIEAIVVDYIRPSLFGGSTVIPNIAQASVWALSAFALGGLYFFSYSDVGIVNAIKMLWGL